MKNQNKHAGPSWSELRPQIYTPEEIQEADLRVQIIGEIIAAREQSQNTQMSLSKMSGVKQPVIARLETGNSDPRISTILRILAPLGKTLKVVPIDQK